MTEDIGDMDDLVQLISQLHSRGELSVKEFQVAVLSSLASIMKEQENLNRWYRVFQITFQLRKQL